MWSISDRGQNCVRLCAGPLPLKVLSEAMASPDKSERQIASPKRPSPKSVPCTSNCCTPSADPISVLFISDPLISLLICSAWQAAKRKTFNFLPPPRPSVLLCSLPSRSPRLLVYLRDYSPSLGESSTPSGLLTQLCAVGNFTVTDPPPVGGGITKWWCEGTNWAECSHINASTLTVMEYVWSSEWRNNSWNQKIQ